MKFSEIERDAWDELRPFLDTCMLPVTGLNGSEQPADATEALERLRDVLDIIEGPFNGRVVTYPALHYSDVLTTDLIETICSRLKGEGGFKYVILAAASAQVSVEIPSADLYIAPGPDGVLPERSLISAAVQSMWQRPEKA